MDILIRIFSIVGSLGLFLLGMKAMSESLQRIIVPGLRQNIPGAVRTPFRQIASGAVMTMGVNSSGAVTSAIVSFVNSGLITLRQAIGLILGSHVGTTVTVWIIAILGFRFHLTIISFPLVGLGFTLILTHKSYYKSLGSVIIGFALMLFGLTMLQTSVMSIDHYESFIHRLHTYASLGFWSTALFLLLGALLSAVLRSSSISVVLTMMMCMNGWIPLETAIAMVLGANLGTTLTANRTAGYTNTDARRAALTHTLTQAAGLIWAIPLLSWSTGLSVQFFNWIGIPKGPMAVPLILSFYHTGFNLINTLILSFFIPQIEYLASRIIPRTENGEQYHLVSPDASPIATAPLLLVQAENELINQAGRIREMFRMVRRLTVAIRTPGFHGECDLVFKYEEEMIRSEKEIIRFLLHIASHNNGEKTIHELQSMFRVISHMELIRDSSMELTRILRHKNDNGLWFNDGYRKKLSGMFDLTEQALETMKDYLDKPSEEKIFLAQGIEEQINALTIRLRSEQLFEAQNPGYKHLVGITFLELIVECEKLSNSAVRISTGQEH